LAALPEVTYDDNGADNQSDNLSDFGSANGKPTISLKHTNFCMKQFAQRMRQAN